MKAGLELRQHAAVAHAFDALSLMPLGHVRADERERHRVEPPLEHRVDVEHQLARNAVLIRGDAEIQRAHRPLDGRPMQRGETRADPERAAAEIGAGGRKDRRVRDRAPAPRSSIEAGCPTSRERRWLPSRECRRRPRARCCPFHARAAPASTRSRTSSRLRGGSSAPRRSRSGSLAAPSPNRRFNFARSAGQSRQKSGLMQGLCEMRMLLCEQEPVDGSHQRAMAWKPPSTMSSSPVMNEPATSLASSSVAPISSRASPNRAIGVCAMIFAMRSG